MSKSSLAAIIAVLFVSPAVSFAADKAAPAKPAAPAAAAPAATPAPTRPPEYVQLAYFEGNWTCSGKAFAGPMGPEHATTGSVHAAKSVGDMWLHVNYDENKTAANPVPFHVGVYIGYDTAKKKFAWGCVDNFGGYCTESSAGWNGDTMVFEGATNGGQQSNARDTFVKKSATEFTHTGAMLGEDKQWHDTDLETCRKGK